MTSSVPRAIARRGLAHLGIDSHILATLLFRFWSVAAGGLTVLLIPLCLTSVQQGYYYTFASILAMQIFFELGMGQVVIQIVAHEAVHLRYAGNAYEGETEHLARMALFKRLLHRWYLPAALLFLLGVNCAGLMFFRTGELPWQQWAIPWALLVGATAVNLYLSWKLAVIEGFALVRDLAQLRLKQSMIGYLLMWVVLGLGGGLWVVAAVPATAAVYTALWLRRNPAAAIMSIRTDAVPSQRISWAKDIFPFQWRIAVSWISGYFLTYMFTPLLFRHAGAAEAGRLGLAMTVFSSISVIGMSWVNAKAANFSMLIAQRESAALLKLFRDVAIRSILFTAALACVVWIGAWCCSLLDLALIHRVASLPVLAGLALVTTVNSFVFAAAVFMRAHREEPMLAVSITVGALSSLAAFTGSRYGAEPMIAAYAAVTVFVCLPWTFLIFRRYLKRHKSAAAAGA